MDPIGPGWTPARRVVQCDTFNRSRIGTTVVVPLTTNPRRAEAPGNVTVSTATSGLAVDSVANVSLVLSLDRSLLDERSGHLGARELERVLGGIDVVLGRG